MTENSFYTFPWEIKDVEKELVDKIHKSFLGEHTGMVRVGPHGYMFPEKYKEEGSKMYNLPLRKDDIFVATFPRSGTTWTQEIVWLLMNDLDYEKANLFPPLDSYVFLEFCLLWNSTNLQNIKDLNGNDPEKDKVLDKMTKSGAEILAETNSPRFIKTHLPLSLLPPKLLDTCKVIYVARDPRDTAVSFYHHNRLIKLHDYIGDFKTYWEFFVKGNYTFMPFFPQIKEAWEKRNHPNMLFLFYEDMYKDLLNVSKNIAKFLGKQYTDQELAKLCEYVKIENVKSRIATKENFVTKYNKGEEGFVRKGKSGGWRDYFDEEMKQQAEEWISENLRDTDLRFPAPY